MASSPSNIDVMRNKSVQAIAEEVAYVTLFERQSSQEWGTLTNAERENFKKKNASKVKGIVPDNKYYALYNEYILEGLNFIQTFMPNMMKDVNAECHHLTNLICNSMQPVLMMLTWENGYDKGDATYVDASGDGYCVELTMRAYNKKYMFASDNLYLLEPVSVYPTDTRDSLISSLDYLFVPAFLYMNYNIISEA